MKTKYIKDLIIKPNMPLTKFTTWKIGGPAQWLGEPRNINELVDLVEWAKKSHLSYHIIGAGSNLLISDNGLHGLTICTRKMHGYNINGQSGIVDVAAGETIPNIARKVAKKGLHGLEWSVGIPGTIGGATVMNAGAQEGCIADRLISVKVFSVKENNIFELKNEDLEFSYRKSLLQQQELIVLSARFKLEIGHDPLQITKVTNQNLNHRLQTQPYHLPSCGSVFRNHQKFKAGQIIEELGLKGLKEGGVQISNMHANFIINNGTGTAKDILSLISLIKEKVSQKHGFSLQTEVKQLGFQEIA